MTRGKHHLEVSGDGKIDGDSLKKRVGELEVELAKNKADADEYKNLLQRLQADFVNHLKRSEVERTELQKNASKELVKKLVDVLDTMELALNSKPKDGGVEQVLDGFRRVYMNFKSILASEGLEDVPASGVFSHELHEVVETVVDCSKPDGVIVDVVQNGYKLNGKLMRASKVIVVKNNKVI